MSKNCEIKYPSQGYFSTPLKSFKSIEFGNKDTRDMVRWLNDLGSKVKHYDPE